MRGVGGGMNQIAAVRGGNERRLRPCGTTEIYAMGSSTPFGEGERASLILRGGLDKYTATASAVRIRF